ncbi:hypothetical protein M3Y97_00988700 [Aphelenchoides bicaudatus]|nr:hypothetical protein M3Y97_00988700 [Aphelenchoides bicaudatus]
MGAVLLKLGLLLAMVVLTAVAGLTPIWVLRVLRKQAALAQTPAQQKYKSLILCFLTCFSGGVFLATCFLHLFPELSEHLDYMRHEYGYTFDYPVAELLSCAGFFALFFIEELVIYLMPSIAHADIHMGTHTDMPTTMNTNNCMSKVTRVTIEFAEPERCEINCEKVNEHPPPIRMKSKPHAHSHGTRSATIVLAIAFHAIIEGLALGVQQDPAKIWAIFISLTVHKLIVAFSVGLQLARTHAHSLHWVVVSMILIALMTPLGGLLGMLVQNAPINAHLRDFIVLICQGLAVGTFIYVTFFEVLIHERDNENPNLLKLLMMILGFTFIGLIRFLAESHSHSHGGEGHSHSHDGHHH